MIRQVIKAEGKECSIGGRAMVIVEVKRAEVIGA